LLAGALCWHRWALVSGWPASAVVALRRSSGGLAPPGWTCLGFASCFLLLASCFLLLASCFAGSQSRSLPPPAPLLRLSLSGRVPVTRLWVGSGAASGVWGYCLSRGAAGGDGRGIRWSVHRLPSAALNHGLAPKPVGGERGFGGGAHSRAVRAVALFRSQVVSPAGDSRLGESPTAWLPGGVTAWPLDRLAAWPLGRWAAGPLGRLAAGPLDRLTAWRPGPLGRQVIDSELSNRGTIGLSGCRVAGRRA
jgi:hypothetical protein